MGAGSQIIESSQFLICSLGGFREAECRDGLLKHSGQEFQGTIVQYSSTRALRMCVSIGSVPRLSVFPLVEYNRLDICMDVLCHMIIGKIEPCRPGFRRKRFGGWGLPIVCA